MANLRSSIVDALTIHDIDMHGRRIKNAATSVDPGDYVTKRELNNSNGNNRVYSLTIGGTIGIGTDLAPRLYIPDDGTIQMVRGDLKSAAIGGPVSFTIYQNNTYMISLIIPESSLYAVATTAQIAALVKIKSGSYWRVDINRVGSTNPGADLTITILTGS